MTAEDVRSLANKFGDAAERAVKASFDGIQIHLGHGYGLCQFVSPFLNGRTDEYGGSLENRARIALEIYREVRRRVGPDCPIITKMNCDDFIDGGTTPDMMIEMAGMLEAEGLDGVEMSGGIGHPKARFGGARGYDPRNASEEIYYRDAAALFKASRSMPLILVGGIRSLEAAGSIVGEGLGDFVSMCRPFISENNLVNRWRSGDERRARCISCNRCDRHVPEGKGLSCIMEEKTA